MRILCVLILLATGACSATGPFPAHIGSADPQQLIVVAVENPASAITRRTGGTPRAYGSARYRISPAAQRDLAAIARAHRLIPLDAWPIDIIGMHCAVLEVPAGRSRAEVLSALSADPRVQLAQPLQTFATSGVAYDDPHLDLQVGLREMNIRQAHEMATGKGVRIAVVDTGMDFEHPDLEARVFFHRDFAGGDLRQFKQDLHGTAVAGVIAAVANNSIGIAGVAPDARILALKACWYPKMPREGGIAVCNTFTLARAIAAAIEHRAQVINLSLAGPADPLLERLLRAAIERGVLVVAAEQADAAQTASFPAAMPGVIGVEMADAARRARDGRLQAPGREILTLRPGVRYDFESGSSMAAAHVSGVVALLLEHRAALPSAKVVALLESSIQEVALTETSARPGIDACAAVATLLDSGGCTQEPLVRTVSTAQKKALSSKK